MSVPLHLLLHVLTLCVSVAIGMSLHAFAPVSRVVEVDSDAIMRWFVADLGEASQAQVKERTATFVTTMQTVLDRFAQDNGVIVVESSLAIAGARDISDEAFQRVLVMMPQPQDGAAQ